MALSFVLWLMKIAVTDGPLTPGASHAESRRRGEESLGGIISSDEYSGGHRPRAAPPLKASNRIRFCSVIRRPGASSSVDSAFLNARSQPSVGFCPFAIPRPSRASFSCVDPPQRLGRQADPAGASRQGFTIKPSAAESLLAHERVVFACPGHKTCG